MKKMAPLQSYFSISPEVEPSLKGKKSLKKGSPYTGIACISEKRLLGDFGLFG